MLEPELDLSPHSSWRRGVTVVVGVSLVTSLAAHVGWLDGFETSGLDTLLSATRIEARHVTVVEITDADYEVLFDGRSPLDPGRLREVLTAIAKGRPRLVAVDLETDPDRIVSAPVTEGEPGVWPPTVWTAPLTAPDSDPAVVHGVAAFPADRDGVIRRYHRRVRGHGNILADSLPWVVVQTYCADAEAEGCRHVADASPDEELLLNFVGERFDFHRLTTADLLAAANGEGWGTSRGPLFDRIVLVGGVYTIGRDTHVTPLGEMAGVYVVAQAIESELAGRGIRTANELLMILLDIAGGLILLALHRQLPLRTAFWLSVFGVPLLALGSSIIAFYNFSRWASFAPTFLGVLIHQLYEGAMHAEDQTRRARAPAVARREPIIGEHHPEPVTAYIEIVPPP